MELRQLEYFVAVAEEANFTRGAQRVRVAQPGVSAQIRRLERELGYPLFDRSGRTIRLTPVGEAVLPYARAALAATGGARDAVAEMAGLVRGRVAVGMIVACSTPAMFELLAAYHTAYPAVEMTLSEANSDQLVRQVRDGTLDLALVGAAGPGPEGLDARVLLDEPLVAAVPPEDPLAGRAAVNLAGLRGRSLVSLPVGTGVRACLDEACAAARVALRIAFEASDPQAVAQLAARGLGVAILPASLAELHSDTLVAVPVTHPVPHSRLEFTWRTGATTSPAARALVALARSGTSGALRPATGR